MIVKTVFELQKVLAEARNNSKSIGFVPTMGALHTGHLQLIQRASEENDLVVVSIFVNPMQFNNKEDLLHYPRTIEKDLDLLKENCSNFIVFYPETAEIYPSNDNFTPIDLGHLDEVLEGNLFISHEPGNKFTINPYFKILKIY